MSIKNEAVKKEFKELQGFKQKLRRAPMLDQLTTGKISYH
jgi:hypothetical protein